MISVSVQRAMRRAGENGGWWLAVIIWCGAVIGALAGAAIGNNIGKKMDAADRQRMRDAEQRAYAAPLNETIIWNNPDNGHSGTVTPIRDGRRQTGEYCREFQSEINIGGQREKGYGTACL